MMGWSCVYLYHATMVAADWQVHYYVQITNIHVSSCPDQNYRPDAINTPIERRMQYCPYSARISYSLNKKHQPVKGVYLLCLLCKKRTVCELYVTWGKKCLNMGGVCLTSLQPISPSHETCWTGIIRFSSHVENKWMKPYVKYIWNVYSGTAHFYSSLVWALVLLWHFVKATSQGINHRKWCFIFFRSEVPPIFLICCLHRDR